jgi:hypothetical protein
MGWTTGVRFPTGTGFFFSLSHRIQTGSEAHQSFSLKWVPGALSSGVGRSGRDADHSPPLSAEFNEAPYHKNVLENGGIPSRILNLCNRWRCVVSFTLRLLYSRDKTPGTHSVGDWVDPRACLDAWRKENVLTSAGNRATVFYPVALSLY